MLTELPPLPEPRISGVVYDDDGENPRRFALDQFDSDQMTAYGQACQAATLATVTPLVQQMQDALVAAYPELNGLAVMSDRALVLAKQHADAITAARAFSFLSGATKESTDA